jgi:hypothetical protein
MKTYMEIEEVVDAFLGHSDEKIPPELANADKWSVVAALRWVLGKEVFGTSPRRTG